MNIFGTNKIPSGIKAIWVQVSAIYLTNVPVASLSFLGTDEIAVALESPHVLGVRLARKTSQSYATIQDHRQHIR